MATVIRLINTVTRDLIDWGYNVTPIHPGMNLMDDFAAAFDRLGITRKQGSTAGQSHYVYNWNTGFYECVCNGGEYNIPVTYNEVFSNFIEPNSSDITSMVKQTVKLNDQGVDIPFIYTVSFSSNGIGIGVMNFSRASIIRNVDANKNSQGAGEAGGGPNLTSEFNQRVSEIQAVFGGIGDMYNSLYAGPILSYPAKFAAFEYMQYKGAATEFMNPKAFEESKFYNGGYVNGIYYAADDFGNYFYGVAAHAMGITLFDAVQGAGIYAIFSGSVTDWTNGYGFFDERKDTQMIIRGVLW